MLEFRRYEIEYYFTLREFIGVAPYSETIDWYTLLHTNLPYAPIYGNNNDLKPYLVDLLNNVYSRFEKHYIYWGKNETLSAQDRYEIALKIANIIMNTYDKYAQVYKYYKDKENSLMSMIESESTGAIRYNDTPQNGGDFNNDAHTTNYTGSKTVNKTEGDTPINRLVEIKNKLSSILFEWSNEFDRIMLEEGNI